VADISEEKTDYLSNWRKEHREAALDGDLYDWVWYKKTFLHGGTAVFAYRMYARVTHLVKCHNFT